MSNFLWLKQSLNNQGSGDADCAICSVLRPLSFNRRSMAGRAWRLWYYPIAGLVMLGVTVMLLRGKRAALWLYAALLLATMIWGVWEVGFDFWALTPRSGILVFFGIWLILPFVWRRLPVPSAGAVGALVVALLISGGMLTGLVLTTRRRSTAP